jgi:anti-anti-sigma factor
MMVTGELDLDTRDQLISAVHAALAGLAELELDLGEVSFCDSSGISGLVAVHRMAREAGKQVLVTHAHDQVASTLAIAGVLATLTGEDPGGGH